MSERPVHKLQTFCCAQDLMGQRLFLPFPPLSEEIRLECLRLGFNGTIVNVFSEIQIGFCSQWCLFAL